MSRTFVNENEEHIGEVQWDARDNYSREESVDSVY